MSVRNATASAPDGPDARHTGHQRPARGASIAPAALRHKPLRCGSRTCLCSPCAPNWLRNSAKSLGERSSPRLGALTFDRTKTARIK